MSFYFFCSKSQHIIVFEDSKKHWKNKIKVNELHLWIFPFFQSEENHKEISSLAHRQSFTYL